MDIRYSLRFESGERRGETIPIPAGGFTVGRRPGHSLQILDNSVSGKHAEILIDEQGAVLKDSGSTNGTRVRDQRVLETRLAHGDHITFGNVQLLFLDAQMGDVAAAPEAVQKTAVVPTPDGLNRVSADVLARSKNVSRPGILVLLLLVIGGGLWWYFNRSDRGSAQSLRPVLDVEGDLFADEFSFETEHDTWTSAENSPAAFLKSARARWSGAFGVSCELGDGEWAVHCSKSVRADPERELVARAMLRASGKAVVQVGVEFSTNAIGDAAQPGSLVAWSKPVSTDSFEAIELSASVPPGYNAARALVFAWAVSGAGGAAADDVSLVQRAAGSKPAASVAEYQLFLHGTPPNSAHLFKVDRVLISRLEFGDSAGLGDAPAALYGTRGMPLTARAEATGIALVVPSGGSPVNALALRCEAPLARTGIATIGADGYKTHGLDFERAQVQSLILGSKIDLVRFKFAQPVKVRGVREASASRILVELGAGGSQEVLVQLDFKEERTQAGNIAHAARNAEKKGDLGECLEQWARLLDTYPYEEALVSEAEATRGRLVQTGLEELRVVRTEIERARFFRLVDLFRQCREKALRVGSRFARSEVESEARRVAGEVDQDLAGLEADLDKAERARLTAILDALEAQKASGLAGEVREYLTTRLGRTPNGDRSPAHIGDKGPAPGGDKH